MNLSVQIFKIANFLNNYAVHKRLVHTIPQILI